MPPRAKKRKKKAGVGLCCRECGGATYVLDTRPRGTTAVDRRRKCGACGWECVTSETVKK